jgi:L-ascorbate metabolism protein UlaG (beta-lactamase superfamily)
MKLQLIRNATLKLDYAGRTVLIDPYSVRAGTGRGNGAEPLPLFAHYDLYRMALTSAVNASVGCLRLG